MASRLIMVLLVVLVLASCNVAAKSILDHTNLDSSGEVALDTKTGITETDIKLWFDNSEIIEYDTLLEQTGQKTVP